MRKGKMLAKIFGTILTVLAILSICGALPGIANVEPVAGSPGIIYVPDDYAKIQAAVDNATSGDTVIVRDGTYHENVDVVTSQLTIQSENGTANCVVNASSPNDHVFNVTTDWVNITGFTVENATEAYNAGICLSTAAHCNVSNNNVMNNYYGIYLYYSSNNTLTNNTASNNWYGISLYSSSDNNLTNNTASNNWYGIFLYSSNNSMLTNNAANSNGDYGIWLASSNNNTLANNTAASNNCDGMHLYLSTNNTLTDNTCANNNHSGIYVSFSCNNNTIYNNCFNNTVNAYDEGTNIWNTTKTLGTNIIGGHYLGGNYWSDYSGNDTNRDGFGDTPYNITGGANRDYLPLTTPALIDVIRNLPDTVQRGETFNVTVTFTAPEDKFNAIGLTDFAPDGWNVTVDETWCTPTADAVLATGNKAEIAWYGEPGVGFYNGTSFNALYKVAVPDYAPLGIHTFYGVLEYYLAGEGPYYENIIGDSEIDVIGATLEGHVSYIARDESPLQWIEPFEVKLFEPGNLNNVMWTGTAITNTTGVFTITRLIPGTYDIGIKNWTCLSELETNVTLTGDNTTVVDFGTTREGDADGDDAVTGMDFSLVAGAFNSLPGDDNWNPNCDFNRNNAVTGMDFSLLAGNFNKVGPLQGY